jgi:hypothetical protein
MSQTSSEKFLYFTVGFLKGSPALDALRQDATKYHMIDHPGQLIALRLTEYYELMSQGAIQPVVRVPAVKQSSEAETTAVYEQVSSADVPQRPGPASFPPPPVPLTAVQSQPAPIGQTHKLPADTRTPSTGNGESTHALNQLSGKMRALRRENEGIVSVSSTAEQNADEAADYWSTL